LRLSDVAPLGLNISNPKKIKMKTSLTGMDFLLIGVSFIVVAVGLHYCLTYRIDSEKQELKPTLFGGKE